MASRSDKRPNRENVELGDFLVINETREGKIPIVSRNEVYVVAEEKYQDGTRTISAHYDRLILQKKNDKGEPEGDYLVGEKAEKIFKAIQRAEKA